MNTYILMFLVLCIIHCNAAANFVPKQIISLKTKVARKCQKGTLPVWLCKLKKDETAGLQYNLNGEEAVPKWQLAEAFKASSLEALSYDLRKEKVKNIHNNYQLNQKHKEKGAGREIKMNQQVEMR